MELKNIKRYFPDEKPYGEGVQYFLDENGTDFYDSFEFFTKKIKLCIEPKSNIIRSFSEDISTLYPVGFDVVEVDELPDGFNIYGDFKYFAGQVIKRAYSHSEFVEISEDKKFSLLTTAANKIAPLQDAVDISLATEDEVSKLLSWKKYRVLLSRIDTSAAPNISWPQLPE